MDENVGQKDRIIRFVLGFVLLLVGILLTVEVSQVLGVIVTIIGVVSLITALINFCPLYVLLGMNTKEQPSTAE